MMGRDVAAMGEYFILINYDGKLSWIKCWAVVGSILFKETTTSPPQLDWADDCIIGDKSVTTTISWYISLRFHVIMGDRRNACMLSN